MQFVFRVTDQMFMYFQYIGWKVERQSNPFNKETVHEGSLKVPILTGCPY